MTEYEQAILLANRVLEKPYIDPDGDICLLARQFLRLVERNPPTLTGPLIDELGAGLNELASYDSTDPLVVRINEIWARALEREALKTGEKKKGKILRDGAE